MFDILIRLRTSCAVPYVHIDSPVFRLHWCLTSSILLVFSLFMITQQYVGTPVSCKSGNSDFSDIIDQFCWIHPTYYVPITYSRIPGQDFPHQGFGPEREESVRYVSYYKWVGFMLLFQSILFYLPRVFWKNLERGKIRMLVKNLDKGLKSEGDTDQQQKLLVDYLYDNLKTHNRWAYWYYFCELLALINVILQILLTNKFLDGVFLTLGLDILTSASSDMENIPNNAFPTTSKCLFTSYDSNGGQRKTDALCMLPLNVFNEYIYKFLWFWFFLLILLSVSALVLRIVLLLAPQARRFFLKKMFSQVKEGVVNTLVRNSKAGDCLLFDLLCKNLEENNFVKVMEQLAGKLGNFKHDDRENMPLYERPCM